MSVVKCKVLNYVKISVYAQILNVKPLSLFPIDKLGTRPLSNVDLKLPDNGIGGWLGAGLRLKTIGFTSSKYNDRFHLCVEK